MATPMAQPAIEPIELTSADETVAREMTRWLTHLQQRAPVVAEDAGSLCARPETVP